jgi:hypothetical protein
MSSHAAASSLAAASLASLLIGQRPHRARSWRTTQELVYENRDELSGVPNGLASWELNSHEAVIRADV